eukprot:3622814-Amphidinium_carterae.1
MAAIGADLWQALSLSFLTVPSHSRTSYAALSRYLRVQSQLHCTSEVPIGAHRSHVGSEGSG